MRVTNPNKNRSLIATITNPLKAEQLKAAGAEVLDDALETYEIPPGESIDVENYVVASTLVEYGAKADPADLEAARQLWAEENRARNSQTASASASEGEILQRRQVTVDTATGTSSVSVEQLKGEQLKAAVDEANAAGATIPVRASADEKRDQLSAWQLNQGSSTPVDSEFVVNEQGDLVLDDEGQPYALVDVVVDAETGKPVLSEDGRPTLLSDASEDQLAAAEPDRQDTSAEDAAAAQAAKLQEQAEALTGAPATPPANASQEPAGADETASAPPAAPEQGQTSSEPVPSPAEQAAAAGEPVVQQPVEPGAIPPAEVEAQPAPTGDGGTTAAAPGETPSSTQ